MGAFKKFIQEDWRYRSPSLSTMLGITQIKKKIRKATGINAIARWTKPSRVKQRILQKAGWYGDDNPLRTVRQLGKGNIKSPFRFLPKIGD